jgi:hypothetical protein
MHNLGLDLFDVHTRHGYVNIGLLKLLRKRSVEAGNNALVEVIDSFIEKEYVIFEKSIELLCVRNELKKGSAITTEDLIHNIITTADLRKFDCTPEINIIEALPSDYDGYTQDQKTKTRSIYNLFGSILEEYRTSLNT